MRLACAFGVVRHAAARESSQGHRSLTNEPDLGAAPAAISGEAISGSGPHGGRYGPRRRRHHKGGTSSMTPGRSGLQAGRPRPVPLTWTGVPPDSASDGARVPADPAGASRARCPREAGASACRLASTVSPNRARFSSSSLRRSAWRAAAATWARRSTSATVVGGHSRAASSSVISSGPPRTRPRVGCARGGAVGLAYLLSPR